MRNEDRRNARHSSWLIGIIRPPTLLSDLAEWSCAYLSKLTADLSIRRSEKVRSNGANRYRRRHRRRHRRGSKVVAQHSIRPLIEIRPGKKNDAKFNSTPVGSTSPYTLSTTCSVQFLLCSSFVFHITAEIRSNRHR